MGYPTTLTQPTSPELIEDTIIRIRHAIWDRQRPALLAVSKRYAGYDKVTIEPVPASSIYGSEMVMPVSFPAVMVVGDTTDFSAGENSVIADHSVHVIAVHQGQDVQDLTKRSWRYAKALVAALWEYGDNRIRVHVARVNYGPVFRLETGSSRSFVKDATLYLRVDHFEERF